MTDLEAINLRYSRRNYLDTPISADNMTALKAAVGDQNKISGLNIQLIEEGGSAFKGILKSYGMFHGVRSFFALVGKTDDPDLKEKAGYYGELLTLEATKLGLGTCWVGASYDKKHCPCTIQGDETLVCVITVGNAEENQSFREKLIYKMTHRSAKSLEDHYTADTPVPEWFLSGMEAVRRAPSAVNAQPVHAEYRSGKVTLFVKDPGLYRMTDLGIAKAHFEIGAAACPKGAVTGSFPPGNHSVFQVEDIGIR